MGTDMEMIPSLANYFGVSIDELFGYNNERSKKTDELAEKIEHMNAQNNGVNFNIDECILKARDALIEFPGNEKLMLCLASVLYNAGYVLTISGALGASRCFLNNFCKDSFAEVC